MGWPVLGAVPKTKKPVLKDRPVWKAAAAETNAHQSEDGALGQGSSPALGRRKENSFNMALSMTAISYCESASPGAGPWSLVAHKATLSTPPPSHLNPMQNCLRDTNLIVSNSDPWTPAQNCALASYYPCLRVQIWLLAVSAPVPPAP